MTETALSEQSASAEPPPPRRRVAHNAASLLAARIVSDGLSLLTVMVLTRCLSPELFGRYSNVLTFSSLFLALADCGLLTMMVREMTLAREKIVDYLHHFFGLQVCLSAVCFLAIGTTATLTERSGAVRALIYVASLDVFLYGLRIPFRALYSAHEAFAEHAVYDIVYNVLSAGLKIAAAVAGFGLMTIFLVGLAARCAALTADIIVSRRFAPIGFRWDTRRWGAQLRQAGPFAVLFGASMIVNRIDIVLLAKLSTEAAVGVYTVASRLTYQALSALDPLTRALYPVFTRKYAASADDAAQYAARIIRYQGVIGCSVGLAQLAFADLLIPLLFGGKYGAAVAAARVMSLYLPLTCLYNPISNLMVASGHVRTIAFWTVGAIFVNVGLNLWAIPHYGILGAAAVTLATELFMVLACFREARGLYAMQLPLRPLSGLWTAALLCGAALLFLRDVSRPLALLCGLLIYAVGLRVCGILTGPEWAALAGLAKRGRSKREGRE